MKQKWKIISPIIIIMFIISFIFYQKINDDKYDTTELLTKQEQLNKNQTKELASKTLILCSNNFDKEKSNAIKTDKTGENIYTLTYKTSRAAEKALK